LAIENCATGFTKAMFRKKNRIKGIGPSNQKVEILEKGGKYQKKKHR
jgi:hypothetical protein